LQQQAIKDTGDERASPIPLTVNALLHKELIQALDAFMAATGAGYYKLATGEGDGPAGTTR